MTDSERIALAREAGMGEYRMIDYDPKEFWKRVERLGDDQCWPWLGTLTAKGYGRFSVRRKGLASHRIAYELMIGEIPAGLVIDHKCRNRKCVNPDHLRAVTNRQNVLENSIGPTAINAAKGHCKQGHPLIEKNIRYYGTVRICKTCHKARNLSYRLSALQFRPVRGVRMHPMDGMNPGEIARKLNGPQRRILTIWPEGEWLTSAPGAGVNYSSAAALWVRGLMDQQGGYYRPTKLGMEVAAAIRDRKD